MPAGPRCAGRKRKPAAISLPSLDTLAAADRPRVARARMQAVARPLEFDARHDAGEVVIHQRQAPKVRADDRMTPERRRHAKDADLLVAVDTYKTARGEATGLKRQRLISPLERLWKAAVLDADQYGAARRFQRDVELAVMAGPRMSVKYEARLITGIGQPFLSPMEAQQSHAQRVEAARRACGEKLSRMLEWNALEPCGWRQAAKAWWPHASERAARSMFKRELALACRCLDEHYRSRGI